jgi:hypothetical protein
MIDQERETVRAVAWSEVLPWLSLFRTFRLAIRVRAMFLATMAILLTVYGWVFIDWAFGRGESPAVVNVAGREFSRQNGSATILAWKSLTSLVPEWDGATTDIKSNSVESVWHQVKHTLTPVESVWKQLSGRFATLFSPTTDLTRLANSLVCGLWAVIVWGFFGGAITRSAALELAADERVGNGELVAFVKRRWRAYVAAPLFPLLGVLLATGGIFIAGLLLNAGLTSWITAILWPLLLVGGLMMTVLLLGLWFGWPLMWPTISTEGTDSFDALSRTYAYVFQRPLHYLFYVVVAALFGALGWLLVSNFAAAVLALTDWAASWGCGAERFAQISKVTEHGSSLGVGTGAALLIGAWRNCVKLIAVGFLYSYFWTAATAVYFLLRRDVDATEMDEIFVEEEQADEVYGLPKVETDAQGAPVVDPAGQAQPADDSGKTD